METKEMHAGLVRVEAYRREICCIFVRTLRLLVTWVTGCLFKNKPMLSFVDCFLLFRDLYPKSASLLTDTHKFAIRYIVRLFLNMHLQLVQISLQFEQNIM